MVELLHLIQVLNHNNVDILIVLVDDEVGLFDVDVINCCITVNGEGFVF